MMTKHRRADGFAYTFEVPADASVVEPTRVVVARRSSTFAVFAPLVAQTGRRTVVGILAEAGMTGWCRFTLRVGSSRPTLGMATGSGWR